jgi:NADH:ubiquinone oxidoreductase subunit F (NADH-binding)
MTGALPRLLAGDSDGAPTTLSAHLALHGPLPSPGSALIAELEQAGLRGRGGAGFPVAIKMAVVAAGRRRPVVVVNGSESEPASSKDRLLLDRFPHLVLDGALLAARAVHAREVVLAIGARSAALADGLHSALRERADAGEHDPAVRIAVGASGYLAGQETALLRKLGGGPPRPTVVPPHPAERGLRRRPTLVQNVETLAHVALIARHGARWFREIGTAREPGSALVSLSGAVVQPGVYEVALGSPLADLVAAAGGTTDRVRGVLVGGYFGSWVDGAGLAELRLERLGAGVVFLLGAAACPVAETARVAAYLASQSAGQCGPCKHGLPAVAGTIAEIANGRARPTAGEDLRRWQAVIPGRGACHHPDGTLRFAGSALEVFAPEFEQHRRHGPCRACAAPALLPVPAARARAVGA